MKSSGKRVLLVTLFGAAVYAVLAFVSDLSKLKHHLSGFSWWAFALATTLAFGNYLIRFVKWDFYLRRLGIGAHAPGEPFKRLPFGESFSIFLAGFSMSLTPAKAGEVFKSVLLASARGVPVARSAPIVIADRVSDLLALVLLVALGSLAFPGYGWIALAALGLVGAVLWFVAFEGLTLGIIHRLERFAVGARIAPRLREAFRALREVSTPGALLYTTAVSVVAWSFECAALWCGLNGLDMPTSLSLAFFAYSTATIAGALAMMPGGLGGTELAMRTILTNVGHAAPSLAIAATLLTRLATLWFAVVVGFIALAVFRRKYDRQMTVIEPIEGPAPVPSAS